MLTIRFPPHKKVHIWFGLVWYGLVNILCWFTSLYEKISTCDGSIIGKFFKANPTVTSNQLKTVQNSWPMQRSCYNFGSIWWISTYEGSIWGSFSWPIQLWAQVSCTLYKTADTRRDLNITLVSFDGFQHVKGQFWIVLKVNPIGS